MGQLIERGLPVAETMKLLKIQNLTTVSTQKVSSCVLK